MLDLICLCYCFPRLGRYWLCCLTISKSNDYHHLTVDMKWLKTETDQYCLNYILLMCWHKDCEWKLVHGTVPSMTVVWSHKTSWPRDWRQVMLFQKPKLRSTQLTYSINHCVELCRCWTNVPEQVPTTGIG